MAPEERERGITIATAHVEYDDDASLRHVGLPGPRRLHEEHDHRRGPDGRRDPGGLGRRRPDAQTREHILLARQVGVPYIIVFLNKVDMVDDAELLGAGRDGSAGACSSYDFPATTPIIITGALAWKATRAASAMTSPSSKLMDAWTPYIPSPSALLTAIPDADRRRVLHLGSRHRCDRARRARHR